MVRTNFYIRFFSLKVYWIYYDLKIFYSKLEENQDKDPPN